LAEFQGKINETFEMMLANNRKLITGLDCRDENVKGTFDTHDKRLDRHTKRLSEESN
jgi:hypothetical protein